MTKSCSLTLILLVVYQLTFGQTWYKQNLIDIAKVSFPEKPVRQDTLNSHFFKYKSDSALYYIQINPIPDSSLDLNNKETLERYYEGMTGGIIESSKGTLISQKNVKIDGLDAMLIEFSSNAHPNLPNLRFNQIVMIGNTLVSQGYWTDSTLKTNTELDRKFFFESLSITKEGLAQKKQATQNDSPAYKIGYLCGQLTMFALLGLGIYFVIKKVTRKNGS